VYVGVQRASTELTVDCVCRCAACFDWTDGLTVSVGVQDASTELTVDCVCRCAAFFDWTDG